MTAAPNMLGMKAIPFKAPAKWNAVQGRTFVNGLAPPLRSLAEVNAYVNNRIDYTYDVVDEWQAPDVTITRGKGDCEDFALLKRAMLLKTGIQSHDLYLIIGYDIVQQVNHAILAVRQQSGWVYLDNLTNSTLSEDQLSKVFKPTMALSGTKGWIYAYSNKL